MISVIVYGRNDNHGYNLHKRAAISLNAIAHVLTHPGDEIVFVDYNTPDTLPTFIEAIQDTLTEQARRRLRVLRVRPHQHERLRHRTHLAAVESIARNVGLRRSNPDNRWILSTNTDMIFVPHDPAQSLSDMAGGLEDGFFGLPRFALPEGLWETLNRSDPVAVIEQVRGWGTRYQINDVVHHSEDVGFDAPGDFQLMLRHDLFAIGGFDEAMVLGWHVDANIARRLSLRRGPVRSVAPYLFGYHCDHTRQSTLLNTSDRIEDDWVRFVESVDEPDLPGQEGRWGLAEERVEEFRLGEGGHTPAYRRVLDTLVPPLTTAYAEWQYGEGGFNNLDYVPEHVLVYLADLLACFDPDADLLYAGCRPRLWTLVKAAWTAMGRRGRLRLLDGFGWLDPTVPTIPWDEVRDDTAPVLIEFGLASADDPALAGDEAPSHGSTWNTADADRLTAVRMTLETLIASESRRPADQTGRYVIAVNAIHNTFEGLINGRLTITFTPFTSRVRHGWVVRPQPPAAPAQSRTIARMLQARLERSRPPRHYELSTLLRLLENVATGAPLPEDGTGIPPAMLAAPLLALLEDPGVRGLLSLDEGTAIRVRAALEAARPSRHLMETMRLPFAGRVEPEADGSPSRIAAIEDWESPAWLQWAQRHFGGLWAYDINLRSAWVWERVQFLRGLDMTGGLGMDRRALVVATAPDPLYAVLTEHVGHVDVIPLPPAGAGPDTGDAVWSRPAELMLSGRLAIGPAGLDANPPAQRPYDLVVLPHNTLLSKEGGGLAALLAWVDARLAMGGMVAFSANVQLSLRDPGPWLDAEMLLGGDGKGGGFESRLAAHTGLRVIGPFQPRLSRATLDMSRDAGAPPMPDMPGGMVEREGDYHHTASVWFLRKTEPTGPAGWTAFAAAMAARSGAELLALMSRGSGAQVHGDALAVSATGRTPPGLLLYGPYIRLPAGAWRLRIHGRTAGGTRPTDAALALDITMDGSTVLTRDLFVGEIAGNGACVPFTVPTPAVGRPEPAWEFRLSHLGCIDVTVTAIAVEPDSGGAGREDTAGEQTETALLPRMSVGEGVGQRVGQAIIAGVAPGLMAYGPYIPLAEGVWRLRLTAQAHDVTESAIVMTVEIKAGGTLLHTVEYTAAELARGTVEFPFAVLPRHATDSRSQGPTFEYLVYHQEGGSLDLVDVRLSGPTPLPEPALSLTPASAADFPVTPPLMRHLLPRMQKSSAIGQWQAGTITVETAEPAGHLVFGPYLPLSCGAYRLVMDIHAGKPLRPRAPALRLEIQAGETTLHDTVLDTETLLEGRTVVPFFILPSCVGPDGTAPLEVRLSHLGITDLSVRELILAGGYPLLPEEAAAEEAAVERRAAMERRAARLRAMTEEEAASGNGDGNAEQDDDDEE